MQDDAADNIVGECPEIRSAVRSLAKVEAKQTFRGTLRGTRSWRPRLFEVVEKLDNELVLILFSRCPSQHTCQDELSNRHTESREESIEGLNIH